MKRFFLFFILFLSAKTFAQTTEIDLTNSWKFKASDDSVWRSAEVPGNIFKDLFQNRLIPDPYYSDNDRKLQWVENKTWEYTTEFNLSLKELTCKSIQLEFQGLDTYAAVYLNGLRMLDADNMFRSWDIDVKDQLKSGKNTLRIVFYPAIEKAKEKVSALPYQLPEAERVFTRKAQYQYGWDFAPRLITCGIWKPVTLRLIPSVSIERLAYGMNALNADTAVLNFFLESSCYSKGNYSLQLKLQAIGAETKNGNNYTYSINLQEGLNTDTFKCSLKNPKLWWCNGLGDANLYEARVELYKDAVLQDEASLQFGLRTLELMREPDSTGSSFYFKLNGLPVFAKGANLVPDGIFDTRATKSLDWVQLAKESGMNMLRIWGGGIYGSDTFYKACDKNGILVWQDFMFAGAMYPGDEVFLNNVREELKQNIKRISTHPSLALWCGNNEIDEAWNNWGWQKQFHLSNADSLKLWSDYQKLFHEEIPLSINKFSSGAIYVSSSPLIGWGHKESFEQGDSHYWGVWWGQEPFSNYRKKVGRFVSEYGFQSFPSYTTLKKICPVEELHLNSASLRAHQKNTIGDKTIRAYMQKEYPIRDSLRLYSYVSQLLQREGMKIAIEAQRSKKPYCMGSLFWQFNDCWPALSWSAIDYYGYPKAFYYSLKKLYASLLVSAAVEGENIVVSLISDSTQVVDGILEYELNDFYGKSLWKNKLPVHLNKLDSKKFLIHLKDFPVFDSSRNYLNITYRNKSGVLSANRLFFVSPKNLVLPKPVIKITKLGEDSLQVSAAVFIKDLYLYSDAEPLHLSDNYFDLEPGEKKIILQKMPLPAEKDIHYLLLNEL